MNTPNRKTIQVLLCKLPYYAFIYLLISCVPNKEVKGPYFGNGYKNGWADQESIVIWTRLTKNKELNGQGTKFLSVSVKEQLALAELKDHKTLMDSQLPEGATLEGMMGACPGTKGQVKLVYYPKKGNSEKIDLGWSDVSEDEDYTKQWKLNELQSGTQYKVEIYARKNKGSAISDTITGQFITPPKSDLVKNIAFSVVSCHDYYRKDDDLGHKIYKAMANDNLDFYVHTGDIEYYDKPNPYALTKELMRFKWNRFFALPLQRQFFTETTTYFIKDDHDVLRNDAFPGRHYGTVNYEEGLDIFDKEQFPIADKTYKTVRWGRDLQVWILDCRRYRSKNTDADGPEKTILGKEQKQWLFKTLKESDATFKIIVSPTPVLGPDRGEGKNDNHANKAFQYEGQQLRDYINQYKNVYIVNGDRHWQYVTHLPDTNLWEFGCGAGTDEHAGGWNHGKLPEHRFLLVKGGYLRVSVYGDNDLPKLKFEHCNVNGEVVHQELFSQTLTSGKHL